MTKRTLPPAQDAPADKPQAPTEPTPMVIWIHDGPVCVTIVDMPPHVPCGACRCDACKAHIPDGSLRYY